MELGHVECGNREYRIVSSDASEIEGVRFAQVIVELPNERRVPRTEGTKRSFFIWQPQSDSPWMPMPVSELNRIRALCFDLSIERCATDEDQNRLINDMVLMIGDEVVLCD